MFRINNAIRVVSLMIAIGGIIGGIFTKTYLFSSEKELK